jgi:hypothetical protein
MLVIALNRRRRAVLGRRCALNRGQARPPKGGRLIRVSDYAWKLGYAPGGQISAMIPPTWADRRADRRL